MKKVMIGILMMLIGVGASAQDVVLDVPQEKEKTRSWELSLGLGIGANGALYMGDSATVLPFPYVEFDSKYLFWSVFHGGVHLYQTENFKLDFVAHYLSNQMDASENDYASMKRLDDRKATLGVGLAIEYISPVGIIQADFKADVLGTTGGFTASAIYYLPYMLGEKTLLLGGVGVEYNSADYNDYYFGISGKESAASGLAAYEAGQSFNVYFEAGVIHNFTEKISLTVMAQYSLLPGEIKDSPMVDGSTDWKIISGLLYSF